MAAKHGIIFSHNISFRLSVKATEWYSQWHRVTELSLPLVCLFCRPVCQHSEEEVWLVLVRVGSGCSDAMLARCAARKKRPHTHTHTHTLTQMHKDTVPCTSEALVVCGRYPELQPTPVCQEESLCSWGGPSQQTKQGKRSFSCENWKELKN